MVEMTERKSIYLTHNELCEMFDVPEDSAFMVDEPSLIWYPPAEMWRLSINVGTKEEIEKLAEIE